MGSNFFLFFFLGTSTNDLYFHVYLIEGVVQWNKARSDAVNEGSPLQKYANRLSQKFLGYKLVEDYSSPGEYTGNALHVYMYIFMTGKLWVFLLLFFTMAYIFIRCFKNTKN